MSSMERETRLERACPKTEVWSGVRESNPSFTAWKTVALALGQPRLHLKLKVLAAQNYIVYRRDFNGRYKVLISVPAYSKEEVYLQ
jgi:hypothetical protein